MTVILTDPQERTRFLKFMAVGAFGALVDFGIANLLAHFFNMPLVYAGTISFTCAVISNFIWNRYWTYPELALPSIAPPTCDVLCGQRSRHRHPHSHPEIWRTASTKFLSESKSHFIHHTGISSPEISPSPLQLELSCFGTSS